MGVVARQPVKELVVRRRREENYVIYLDAAADLLLGLILLDLCLPSSGGIGDGGGVLRMQLAL